MKEMYIFKNFAPPYDIHKFYLLSTKLEFMCYFNIRQGSLKTCEFEQYQMATYCHSWIWFYCLKV